MGEAVIRGCGERTDSTDNAAPRTVRSEKSIEAQERMKRLAQKPKEAVKQLEEGPKCVRRFVVRRFVARPVCSAEKRAARTEETAWHTP